MIDQSSGILSHCDERSGLIAGSSQQSDGANYWDRYYLTTSPKFIPSQFAAMTLSEMWDFDNFIDCGCGNGRDSIFFASHGKNVLSIDNSSAALEQASFECRRRNLSRVQTQQLDFSSLTEKCLTKYNSMLERCVVYARFFLHSLDEQTERRFFDQMSSAIGKGSMICAEFRTKIDSQLPKKAAPHFRRYIDPYDLVQKIDPANLRLKYMNVGFGLAKFQEEDAHVARVYLEKV